MNNIITITAAVSAAIRAAALENDSPRCTNALLENGYYELTVSTLCQRYTFYVDAETAEVCGIDAEPVYDSEVAYGRALAA